MIWRSTVIIPLCLSLSACGKPAPSPASPKPDPFKAAHAEVSDLMTDPNSAQFRRDRLAGKGFICGEVNAKNQMGGYVGFTPYLYNSNTKKAASSGLPDESLIATGGYLNRTSREKFDRYDDQCTFAKVYVAACSPAPETGWQRAAQMCSVGDIHGLRLKMDALNFDR